MTDPAQAGSSFCMDRLALWGLLLLVHHGSD